MKQIRVKTFLLASSHSVVSKDYSETIEDLINLGSILRHDGQDYLLTDYDIKEIENKSYLILRYER